MYNLVMRIIFISLVVLISASVFGQDNSPRFRNDEPSQIKTVFVPYLQLAYGVIPGAGCSVRFQKVRFGLQIDANMATVVTAGVREATLSALFYPQAKQEREGGWNLGIGGGIGQWHGSNDGGLLPVFPFFAGYQGSKYFVSVSIHPLDRVKPWQKWVPSVKYGWCF